LVDVWRHMGHDKDNWAEIERMREKARIERKRQMPIPGGQPNDVQDKLPDADSNLTPEIDPNVVSGSKSENSGTVTD
jgi:hypothetical protein